VKWDGFRAIVATEDGLQSKPPRLEHDRARARARNPAVRARADAELADVLLAAEALFERL
jgi:hypothetical protein